MIKSLLITVICLLLTACGAKGDLFLPTDKPVEQQQPADPATKSKQQTEKIDS